MPRKSKKAAARSAAARKGWETRRANARRRAALKGWVTRRANANRARDQKGKPEPRPGRKGSPGGEGTSGKTGKTGGKRRRVPIDYYEDVSDWIEVIGIDSLYED